MRASEYKRRPELNPDEAAVAVPFTIKGTPEAMAGVLGILGQTVEVINAVPPHDQPVEVAGVMKQTGFNYMIDLFTQGSQLQIIQHEPALAGRSR